MFLRNRGHNQMVAQQEIVKQSFTGLQPQPINKPAKVPHAKLDIAVLEAILIFLANMPSQGTTKLNAHTIGTEVKHPYHRALGATHHKCIYQDLQPFTLCQRFSFSTAKINKTRGAALWIRK